MGSLFRKLTKGKYPTLYVQLRVGSLKIINTQSGQVHEAGTSVLSHPRTLVADFVEFQEILSEAIQNVVGSGAIRVAPQIVVHPIERIEGGLTAIEAQSILEISVAAGAKSCQIWIGDEIPLSSFKDNKLNTLTGGRWVMP